MPKACDSEEDWYRGIDEGCPIEPSPATAITVGVVISIAIVVLGYLRFGLDAAKYLFP